MQKFIAFFKVFVFLCVAFSGTLVYSQNTVPSDTVASVLTPFRKGRWLTSLSGSISSSSYELKSTKDKTISNEFGINLSTGKFFKDRWFFGVTFQGEKQEARGDINTVGESLYIGPQFARYFTNNKDGSLFFCVE